MSNLLRLPGFVDIHVHLREPGDNKAETIENGSRAAMYSGYVLICDMPNNPGTPTWSEDRLDEKIRIADSDGVIPIRFYAGAQPESGNMKELEGMAKKAAGLKLYGAPTTGNHKDYTAEDFAEIVAEWHRVAEDKPILLHAGKNNLADMIELVAGKHRHHLHICHINGIEDVAVVDNARTGGLPVSCGVCPHHLFKTSHDTFTEGWFARMQPPLATQVESEALWEALVDGRIDMVESDYAPHSIEAKMKAETDNPEGILGEKHTTCYGMPGIEHVGPMMLRQASIGRISIDRLVDAMSANPLKLLGLSQPDDTYVEWEMDNFRLGEDSVRSGSGWSPYVGAVGTGRLVRTVVDGKTVYEAGKV